MSSTDPEWTPQTPEWTPEELREYMDFHGWSQRILAETIGCTEQHMRRMLQGKSPVTRIYRRGVIYANSSTGPQHRCGSCMRGYKSEHPHNRPSAASVQWKDF